MSLTMVFSVPATMAVPAGHALTQAGVTVLPDVTHPHGLPDGGLAWITATGPPDALDAAHAAAEALGGQLRLHWDTPPPAELSPAEAFEARLAALEATILGKGT